MNKLIHCLVITSFLLFTNNSFAKELKNLYFVKENYIKYHNSGEYQKDQTKVIDQAMLYLKNKLESEKKKKSNRKLAIILDIDETALSNYQDMLNMDFGGSEAQIVQAEDTGNDPPIKPTLELFRYAKKNKIAVFFVTGRREHSREATEKNLLNAGYKDWDSLYLKPEDYHEKSPAPYKTSTREQIEKQGYEIILNIGDQESDLSGGHADKTFKLPNPYYYIP